VGAIKRLAANVAPTITAKTPIAVQRRHQTIRISWPIVTPERSSGGVLVASIDKGRFEG
jgi:hypothetical protein